MKISPLKHLFHRPGRCLGPFLRYGGPACALLFAAAGAMAQENEEGWVSAVFSGMGWKNAVEEVYFESVGEERELRLPANRRSSFIAYRGPDPITFYRKATNEEGVVERIPVGRVELGADGETPFLVFIDDGGRGGGSYRLLVLGDDLADTTGSTARFANFSPDPVAVRINDQNAGLQSAEIKTLDLSPGAEGTVTPVMMALYREDDWELFFSTRWELRPGTRRTVFIFPDESGEIQVTYLNENAAALRRLAERTRGRER